MVEMKKIRDLKDLMIEQLRALYNGEKRLERLLPDMIKSIRSEELKSIFSNHLHTNEEQIMRIRQAFEPLYVQKRGEECDAMVAMEKEARDFIKRSTDNVRDAALVTALQHIIHYQIAGYGAVCTYAQMLGFDDIASIIHKNLEEERATDRKLIMLAETNINVTAMV